MPSINIATQPMKLEYNSQRASLNTTTKRAEVIVDAEAAVWDIQQPSGELDIDPTPCRYAYGLKPMPDLVHDYAQAGMDSAIAGIGRIAEEGDRLARIESGENAIANLSFESTMDPDAELTIAYVPLPNIRYTPHRPEIKLNDRQLNVSFQPAAVQNDYNPGQLDIRVVQYPNVNIEWTNDRKVDMMV